MSDAPPTTIRTSRVTPCAKSSMVLLVSGLCHRSNKLTQQHRSQGPGNGVPVAITDGNDSLTHPELAYSMVSE